MSATITVCYVGVSVPRNIPHEDNFICTKPCTHTNSRLTPLVVANTESTDHRLSPRIRFCNTQLTVVSLYNHFSRGEAFEQHLCDLSIAMILTSVLFIKPQNSNIVYNHTSNEHYFSVQTAGLNTRTDHGFCQAEDKVGQSITEHR